MSMLIIGANPPKSCYACSWYDKVDCPVNDGRYYYRAQRHPSCPLISIPTPHGRLIDADALRVLFADWYRVLDDNMREEVALRYIDDAPTVIEAED